MTWKTPATTVNIHTVITLYFQNKLHAIKSQRIEIKELLENP
jgi:hypothetical protein